MLTANALIC